MTARKLIAAICTVGSICTAQAQEGEPMVTAEEVIKKLDLKPLQDEGGYYRETYRSDEPGISPQVFGLPGTNPRIISTAIYYLVTPDSFSSLHRIKSDEVFHFYAGDPVEMIQIDESGSVAHIELGSNVMANEMPQVVVVRGTWQALKLKHGGRWALMGTTVAPGFEFADFELGTRELMLKTFPQLKNDIIRFTREQ